MYRLLRDSREIWQEPEVTPMGFRLMGNPSMESGTFEREETAIVEKCLAGVDGFINIGANIGYYCCLALRRGKPTIAFEPIELNLQYLYRNIKANRWEDNIEIYPMALSNRVGLIQIFGAGTGASLVKGWAGTSEQYVRLVPTSTLDNVLGNRLRGKRYFILVDIEGAEGLMLEGARSVLAAEPKPVWMVEICTTEHQPQGTGVNPHLLRTFEIFWENAYEAWTADRHFRFVPKREIELISKGETDTLGTHNFLFVESGRMRDVLEQ